jgi:hypothetical protein
MKKFNLLLFFSFLNLIAFGQTYTIDVYYNVRGGNCESGSTDWTLEGDSNSIDSSSNDINSSTTAFNTTNTYTTVPNYSTFNLSIDSFCEGYIGNTSNCTSHPTKTLTAAELIQGSTASLSGCNGGVRIDSFKPNLSIQKTNASTTEVCSGEMLDLYGYPSGFPDEAYHWQYSLDDESTWEDVPEEYNNNSTSNFSIQDILEIDHINYWNQTIYFRMGYDQDRPFSDSFAIYYSPCAPIITDIVYDPPKCSGDNIPNVTITFDRDLYTGEYLNPISIIKQDVSSTILNQTTGNITEFDDNKTFSFSNFTGLENGENYTIIYQAFQGTIARGVITTDVFFTYEEIVPLEYTLSATNPSCNNEIVEVKISVTGGTTPYSFSVDGKTTTATENVDGSYSISCDPTATNKILVTDANGCIEK